MLIPHKKVRKIVQPTATASLLMKHGNLPQWVPEYISVISMGVLTLGMNDQQAHIYAEQQAYYRPVPGSAQFCLFENYISQRTYW